VPTNAENEITFTGTFEELKAPNVQRPVSIHIEHIENLDININL